MKNADKPVSMLGKWFPLVLLLIVILNIAMTLSNYLEMKSTERDLQFVTKVTTDLNAKLPTT